LDRNEYGGSVKEGALTEVKPRSEVFGKTAASVGVQSVLFNSEVEHLDRSVSALARAAELAIRQGACSRVGLQYGDCSQQRCIPERAVQDMQKQYEGVLTIRYCFFAENLGSARGHNQLAKSNEYEFILIQNPDVVVSPRLLENLLSAIGSEGVGMVEAKQLPIEHPKEYNEKTGDTSWASTACAMTPASLFAELGGFDADSFFLYCDDVDFSWRVRQAGFRVVHQPSGVVFHDKRIGIDGAWQPSDAERYYSAEASLFLTHKWSRSDLTEKYLASFRKSGVDYLVRAAGVFENRRSKGELPTQIDEQHKIGQFIGLNYAEHRFPL
jgi:GT2 family glycosyltransferase